jgi:hypothetical protein
MSLKFFQTSVIFFMFLLSAQAQGPVFYETVPTIGKFIMMGVAIAIPTFIILSHVPLFELLENDSLPKLPKINKAQKESLKGTIVGVVFGLLITVLCLILS